MKGGIGALEKDAPERMIVSWGQKLSVPHDEVQN
jgi:hypothetical protein